MSLIINDKLIWISIPKCASVSIESALYDTDLNIKLSEHVIKNNFKHTHVPLHILEKEFGIKETICVYRDWFEKWMSSLEYIYGFIERKNNELDTPIYKFKRNWEDVDNEFIYNTFTDEFCYKLYMDVDGTDLQYCFDSLVDTNNALKNDDNFQIVNVLRSQQYYKKNKPCTYEFNINELDKFAELIEQKFGEKIIINKLNSHPKVKNKIIINDELKNFIWDKFEKRFEKRNELI